MKLHYYPETDTLYLAQREVGRRRGRDREDVVVDYDEDRRLLGIEIEHASAWIDLTKLETHSLPIAG